MKLFRKKETLGEKLTDIEESYYVASQWQLMWRKFTKHKLAMGSIFVLVLYYIAGIFCEFLAPYDLETRYVQYAYCPPWRLRFFDEEEFHLRPFVYGIKRHIDPETLRKTYTMSGNTKHT